jgi:hypothetical protein
MPKKRPELRMAVPVFGVLLSTGKNLVTAGFDDLERDFTLPEES